MNGSGSVWLFMAVIAIYLIVYNVIRAHRNWVAPSPPAMGGNENGALPPIEIESVSERDNWLIVYGSGGYRLYSLPMGVDGRLIGYTSSTVTVRRGKWQFTYNVSGRRIRSKPAQ